MVAVFFSFNWVYALLGALLVFHLKFSSGQMGFLHDVFLVPLLGVVCSILGFPDTIFPFIFYNHVFLDCS